MRKYSLISSISLAFILFILGPHVILGQSAITGEWTASTKQEKPDKIHISFERRHENGGKSQNGTSYVYSDLEGLSASQTQNGRVSFRLVREAGTIECEGTFTNGKGAGTFRFNPNRAFIDGMKSRGFDFERQDNGKGKHSDSPEERLFAAATLNVTMALADDLKSANFGDLDTGDLFKAAIFKIDGKFMAEMKATGFPDLGMEELVKARIFKIDPEYVRQVKDMGFEEQGFEGLVKFRIFKVTPEFLNDMRSVGFDKLSSEDIVKCRIFKIDADFVRQAKATEPNISIEELVEMKIGVRRRK